MEYTVEQEKWGRRFGFHIHHTKLKPNSPKKKLKGKALSWATLPHSQSHTLLSLTRTVLIGFISTGLGFLNLVAYFNSTKMASIMALRRARTPNFSSSFFKVRPLYPSHFIFNHKNNNSNTETLTKTLSTSAIPNEYNQMPHSPPQPQPQQQQQRNPQNQGWNSQNPNQWAPQNQG